MTYVLYFQVLEFDERNQLVSVLEANGFTLLDATGGQAAFDDGDFSLFIQCARSTAHEFVRLCRMPDPGLGLLHNNPITGAPDPRVEEWAATGQLVYSEQHFARLHWEVLRRYVSTWAIFFYWQGLTSHLYTSGGTGRNRDREGFEADFHTD